MIGLKRARGLCLAAATMLCMALALPVAAVADPNYVPESKQAYEAQLNKGEIASVTVNRHVRSLRITLKNGSYYLAKYPPKGFPAAAAQLTAKHVPYSILAHTAAMKEVKPKATHHKLRYIAGGALIVVIVVVGVVLLVNRRRTRSAD